MHRNERRLRVRALATLGAFLASAPLAALAQSAQPSPSTPPAIAPEALREIRSRVRPILGFTPHTTFAFARAFEGHVTLVEAIDDAEAARVGCSDLALEPFARCSQPETGSAAILVASDDPARAPFVLALADDLVIEDLSVRPVALDADPEPEFVLVVGEAALEEQFDEEGESYGYEPTRVDTRLVIFDLDGTVYFDDELVRCGYESDAALATDCTEFEFTILDEDHDHLPELRVAGEVGASASALREDRVGGDAEADELLLELEDSIRYFAFVPSARRFVERTVPDR